MSLVVTVRFEQTGYTGVEGERVSVAVELSAVADRTIELGVSAVLDGTANGENERGEIERGGERRGEEE